MAKVHLDPEFCDVGFRCPGCGWFHILNIDPSIRPYLRFIKTAPMLRPEVEPAKDTS